MKFLSDLCHFREECLSVVLLFGGFFEVTDLFLFSFLCKRSLKYFTRDGIAHGFFFISK